MSDIRWFCSDPESEAKQQVENTASMPFVHAVAVMPDCHYGKGSTVGTVVATKGAIMPACVGVDIGCGMIALETNLTYKDVKPHLRGIREGIERRIPTGIGNFGLNSKYTDSAWKRTRELLEKGIKNYPGFQGRDDEEYYGKTFDKNWTKALGSLGGGNHFIEVCIESSSQNRGSREESSIWVILHSGSRGVGNKIGTYWTNFAKKIATKYKFMDFLPDPDLAYLVEKSEDFWLYMKDLYWAQDFARLNRDEMMDRVIEELTRTVCGTTTDDYNIQVRRINCHHNFVQRENYNGENYFITRKGAIEAKAGMFGLIPGSMGTPSYVVEGLGNEGAFNSAPHGAGRAMSRTKARKLFDVEKLKIRMDGIESNIRESIVDEHPDAYKDIDIVMEEARNLVRPIHRLHQLINVKGD